MQEGVVLPAAQAIFYCGGQKRVVLPAALAISYRGGQEGVVLPVAQGQLSRAVSRKGLLCAQLRGMGTTEVANNCQNDAADVPPCRFAPRMGIA